MIGKFERRKREKYQQRFVFYSSVANELRTKIRKNILDQANWFYPREKGRTIDKGRKKWLVFVWLYSVRPECMTKLVLFMVMLAQNKHIFIAI